MKITDINVRRFRYTSKIGRDSEGHAHPGNLELTGSLVTVETDDGVSGHCFGGEKELVENVFRPRMVGRDPLHREFIWQDLAERTRRWNMDDRTLASVDMALWDLAGKAAGMPVYKLIGAYRDKVKAYASTMVGDDIDGGLDTPEAYADFAQTCIERGYQAIKIHSFYPPKEGAPDPRLDAAICRAVRERVGPEVSLMLDPYHDYNREEALYLGRALEELDFAWYEEPMNEYSIASYVWLVQRLDIPVLAPEVALGRHHTRAEWIERGACDMMRVGVNDVGGITPSLKVNALAESFRMSMDVHGPHPGNLHLLGTMRNAEFFERGLLHPHVDYDTPAPYLNSIHDPLDDEGYVHMPQTPGLGYDFDFDYIEKNAV